MRPLAAGCLLFLAPAVAGAQPETLLPIPLIRTAAEIRVDGVVSETEWKDAAVVDTFYETSPGDNTPPKIRTVAYLTYDGKYLYLGFKAFDPEPEKIRAPYVDRDEVIGTDDNIAVFLDTRNDRRSALEFRVNPRGSQLDAVWNDATFSEDLSPDFFYDTAARITAEGWEAEIRIPFSSLRYPQAPTQSWGILIWRNYPRDFRYGIHSSPLPRGSNCHICHMRTLTGLTGLPSGGHLVVAPYATGTLTSEPEGTLGSDLVDGDPEGDAGLDVKWTPNPDHAVDATINPDFSQIESDVAQIAVNERFALFFPEKRPFFLEGVDLFETPVQAVYTRTITSPRWGLHGTGKIGSSAYTVLVAEDRGGGLVILPGPDFSDFAPQDFRSVAAIGRLRRDFGASFAGLLATDREVRGGGHNRLIGPDFQWRPNDRDQITGQFLYSDTETPNRLELTPEWDGRDLSGGALNMEWRHTTRGVNWRLRYRDFGDGFRADNGFVPQVGYRQGFALAGYNFYPKGLFSQINPYVGTEYTVDRSGDLISRFSFPGVFFQGKRNLAGELDLNLSEIRVGGKDLEHTNVFFLLQVDPSRRFSRVSIEGNLGEAIDFAHARVGDGGRLNLTATIKPTDHLALELIFNRQWLDVEDNGREGRLFTAQVGRLKATYTFTARAFLRLIGQYVETERDPSLYRFPVSEKDGAFDGSALFSYKLNWQTVLFLGYGDNRVLLPGDELVAAGRQFFLKISYAFQR